MIYFAIFMILQTYFNEVFSEDRIDANKCIAYTGRCTGLMGTKVFMESSISFKLKEKIISKTLPKLKKYPFGPCLDYFEDLLCYYFHKSCADTNGELHLIQLCGVDCLKAKSKPCNWIGQIVPEYNDIVKNLNCDSLVMSHACKRPLKPTFVPAIKKFCKNENKEKDSYAFEVTKIIKEGEKNNSSRTELLIQDIPYQYRQGIKTFMKPSHIYCSTNYSHIKNKVPKLTWNNILPLKNIGQFLPRRTGWVCEFKTIENITKYFAKPLGIIQRYPADKFLTLKNMTLLLIQTSTRAYMQGSGIHFLCAIKFQYRIWPQNERQIILHAKSREALPFLIVKSATKMKSLPEEIEKVLKYQQKDNKGNFELETKIFNPSWDILWHGNQKVTAFKGIIKSTGALTSTSFSTGTNFETMIGDDRRFTVMRMEIENTKFHQFLLVIKSFIPNLLWIPVLKIFNFNEDVHIYKIEYILSTGSVDIPYCKYLRKHYKLGGALPNNRLKLGLWLQMRGKIIESYYGISNVALVDRSSQFTMEFTHILKLTTFEIKFDIPNDLDCNRKKNKEKNWKIFERLVKILQKQSDLKSKTTQKLFECERCCQGGLKSLLQIRGRFYSEGWYKEEEFLDLDITAVSKNSKIHYHVKKLKLKSENWKLIRPYLPKTIKKAYEES